MTIREYVNIGYNIETLIYLGVIGFGVLGLIYFINLDWKRYGLLFLLASVTGNILCYIFVKLDFYWFPYLLFPKISIMPFTAITFSFPIVVLMGVYYSPEKWGWKIPFYMTIIHIGMLSEVLIVNSTRILKYHYKWDSWDSYTWWWIYYLVFQWIGNLIIRKDLRKPMDIRHLQYGKIGWALIHFIFIITIFLAGYYLGTLKA